MAYRFLADAVLVVHLAFIAFVAVGGLLALRLPLAALVHLPAAAWGAYIELSGGVCPLTPLENRLRLLGGERGYAGSFIEHYLLPVVYPEGLTRGAQLGLAAAVIAVNLVIYGCVLIWMRRRGGAGRV